MKNLIIACMLALLASSCGTQKKLNSWIGSTRHEIIKAYGPPEGYSRDGNGGEIITYTANGWGYGAGITWYLHWYLDRNDKVYHWLLDKEFAPVTTVNIR